MLVSTSSSATVIYLPGIVYVGSLVIANYRKFYAMCLHNNVVRDVDMLVGSCNMSLTDNFSQDRYCFMKTTARFIK